MLAPVTIFIGSFLLFGVQPLVGRTLLPAFGGTSAEWVACLCAFQTLLLLGYLQAHRASAAPARRRIHVALLGVSAAWAFFAYAMWKAFGRGLVGGPLPPGVQVLACVLALCGLPYILLSANSSLVQACVSEREARRSRGGRAGGSGDGRGVYRLYGVSNAGSLAGLLAYPLLLEPHVALAWQWRGFGAGVAIYALLLWRLAEASGRPQGPAGKLALEAGAEAPDPGIRGTEPANQDGETAAGGRLQGREALWLALPAVSCFLLDAVTAHLTLDVMPMPMLWAILLAVFLASYIVGFTGWAERNVKIPAMLFLAALCVICSIHGKAWHTMPVRAMVALYSAMLFLGCTFLHAWLYRIRPETGRLTSYYLAGAVGGAVGGILASLVAPMAFDRVAEYPLAALATGMMAVAAQNGKTASGRQQGDGCGKGWTGARSLATAAAMLLLAVSCFLHVRWREDPTRAVVHRSRGFFGTIQVMEIKARTSKGEGVLREFVHGTTVHGIQAKIPGRERMPTTYYTPDACGYAIEAHPKYRRGEPMRVNLVGLGVGVLFCYGRTNDYYRAYEISSDALAVATDTNLFTFVADCPAQRDIVLGDARQGLEDELRRGVEPYDVIVVDAFTGDNIPYHLSTREAFELYFKLLKPDGVLCVNISNWHLELEPFMRALAEAFDVPLLGLQTQDDFGQLGFAATAAFFCRQPGGLAPPPVGPKCRIIDFNAFRPMASLPTDEKGSFLELVR